MPKNIVAKDLDSPDPILSSFQDDRLKDLGIYFITSEIEEGSLVSISQDILLKHLTPSWNQDILLIVNSPGGSSYEGWMLLDLLEYVRMDIQTMALGDCCSLGAMIVASGTPGKRSAGRRTTFMTHQVQYYGLNGISEELNREVAFIQEEYDKVVQFWIEKSKYKKKEEVTKYIIPPHDVFMSAQTAMSHGIVDKIVTKLPLPNVVATPTRRSPRRKSK